MKKISLSIVLVLICFAFLLVSCGESVTEQSSADGTVSKTESDNNATSSTNKPWYSTSMPDNYVSQNVNESFESASSTVSEEESFDESSEDSSDSESDVEVDGLDEAMILIPERDATSYRVAYTKESELNAIDCITNVIINVTAVYDGSVTRFFNATKGTFYHAVNGKYLYPCCDGFLAGDLDSHNGKYAVMFGFDDLGEVTVSTEHFGHGAINSSYSFYSTFDKHAYEWFNDENGDGLAIYPNQGAVICREAVTDSNVGEDWLGGEYSVTEESLLKYGLVNGSEVVIPFEYDYMVTVYGNSVGVVLARKDGRSYYFSSNGTNLTPDGFDCGSQPNENRAWVYQDGQGYILEFR